MTTGAPAARRARARAAFARGGRGPGLSVYAFLVPLFLILALLVYFPIGRSVAMSLTDQSLLRPGSGRFVGSANFHDTLVSFRFWRLCVQTLAWTVFSVAGALGLGVGAALLVHARRHGAPVAKALLLVPWILPPVVSAFTWGYLYRDSGPLPALFHNVVGSPARLNMLSTTEVSFLSFKLPLWCVIQVGVWSAFPFIFLFTLAGLATIPRQLYEAGALDGATETRLFFWITLPLIAPVLETATLLLVLLRFGGFDLPFLLTQGGPGDASNVLGVYIYGVAFQSFDIGKGAAIGLILFVLTLPLSILYVWRAGRQLKGA